MTWYNDDQSHPQLPHQNIPPRAVVPESPARDADRQLVLATAAEHPTLTAEEVWARLYDDGHRIPRPQVDGAMAGM